MERVLIVGNGYAGLQAAKALACEKSLSVTVVSAESGPAYCPHLLPELVAGRKEPGDLHLIDPEGYASLGVRFLAGAGVEKLSAEKRIALLESGETVGFDKALIASGAKVWVPEHLKGLLAQCGNVLVMKQMGDALALKKFLEAGASRIAIIGAGRVGMLLAEALKDTDASVSVIEIGPGILATMLQPDVAARLRPVLSTRRHLRIRTDAHIADVAVDGGVAREIRLADGTVLPCDVVVIATGVEPNTAFLEGLLGDTEGIPVDSRMRTREPEIYAAGDVVRFETITGRMEAGQLVANARAQGDTAARNIAGKDALCPPSFIGNIVKLDPLIAARIGDIDGSDQADFMAGRSFARVTLEGQAVIGLQLVGDPEDMRGLVPAVLKKFPRGDLSLLLQGRLDLGLAPLLASRSLAWA
ncbi:MAG TPA: FAD-dependent oxidoreductase [Candidatus Limnocylindrales bacterium]|nr:FAD-dependent oxidoreductase [Candidatus Limnocylindrales bacterium]